MKAKIVAKVVPAAKKIAHYIRHFFIFLGPVTDAVKDQCSSKELQKAAVKVLLGGGGIYTSIQASLKDPDAQSDLWAPLTGALFIGAFSLIHDYQTGTPKPMPPPDTPTMPPAAEDATPADQPEVPKP